jgi:hypothetical protein
MAATGALMGELTSLRARPRADHRQWPDSPQTTLRPTRPGKSLAPVEPRASSCARRAPSRRRSSTLRSRSRPSNCPPDARTGGDGSLIPSKHD